MPDAHKHISAHTRPDERNRSRNIDLSALNSRIDILKRDVLPSQPFALSIPSIPLFRPKDALLWQCLRDTPFTPTDVWQQYATFQADAPGRDIITAVLAEDVLLLDEHAQKMSAVAAVEKTDATKDANLNRKKISLKDYKDRNRAGSDVRTAPTTREGSVALPTVEDDERAVKKRRVSRSPERERERSVHARDEEGRGKVLLPPEISPTLPPRDRERRGIPPEISPTLPRFEESTATKRKLRLPSPISPTLPPVLQRHLDRLLQGNREGLVQEKGKEKVQEDSASPSPSLIVRMKIPKGKRKDVQRILQLRVPMKSSKPVTQTSTPTATAKDRDENRKTTPLPESSKKPAPLHKRDGLDNVRQSAEPRTPSSLALASSPTAATDPSRARKPIDSETLRKLHALQEKYNESGKRYKRLSDSARNSTSPSAKEVIGLGIQCILSFMKSFTFLGRIHEKRGVIPHIGHWASLDKFAQVVQMDSKSESSMNGLVWLLLGVCRAKELDAEMARVASDAISKDQKITAKALDMARHFSSKSRAVQDAFRRGYAKLSVRMVASTFPKTWDKQANLPHDEEEANALGFTWGEGASYEKMALGLPVSSVSHPFEVVVIAESLLEEWRRLE